MSGRRHRKAVPAGENANAWWDCWLAPSALLRSAGESLVRAAVASDAWSVKLVSRSLVLRMPCLRSVTLCDWPLGDSCLALPRERVPASLSCLLLEGCSCRAGTHIRWLQPCRSTLARINKTALHLETRGIYAVARRGSYIYASEGRKSAARRQAAVSTSWLCPAAARGKPTRRTQPCVHWPSPSPRTLRVRLENANREHPKEMALPQSKEF